jgi:hypothetical protein
MAGIVQRLCAVSRVSGRSLLTSATRSHAPRSSLALYTRANSTAATPNDLKVGTSETPAPSLPELLLPESNPAGTDWSKSYAGLSQQAFSKEIADVLLAPLDPIDIEIKPGGSGVDVTEHARINR